VGRGPSISRKNKDKNKKGREQKGRDATHRRERQETANISAPGSKSPGAVIKTAVLGKEQGAGDKKGPVTQGRNGTPCEKDDQVDGVLGRMGKAWGIIDARRLGTGRGCQQQRGGGFRRGRTHNTRVRRSPQEKGKALARVGKGGYGLLTKGQWHRRGGKKHQKTQRELTHQQEQNGR